MAWVILILGIALCGAGGAALWSGVAYMPVEWGWSQIIAGATAVSGGIVTLALAAIVHRLRSLQSAMLARVAPQAVAAEPIAEPVAPSQAAIDAEPAEAAVPIVPPHPVPAQERSTGSSRAILVGATATEEPPAEPNGYGRRVGIGDVVGLQMPVYDADQPAGISAAPLPAVYHESPQELEGGGDAAVAPPDEAGGERTVVGRYDAGDASYALFSDGTIEVETETGVHHFASMEDLKAFLERQDSVAQAGWPE